MPSLLKKNKYRIKKLQNGGAVEDPPAESKGWWDTLVDYYKGMKIVANSNPSLKALFNQSEPISRLSTSLANLSIPANIVAEAVEGIGNYGDSEFNITDAIPGHKGDFSFTNINNTPTKTVSGVTGVGGIPGFALDVATDPSSYVGVGVAKNVIKKGLPKVVKAINKTTPIKKLKTLDTGPLKIGGESILDLPKLHLKKGFDETLKKADEFSQSFYGDPNIEKHFTDMYSGAAALPRLSKEIVNDPTFKKRMATYKWINSNVANMSEANLKKIREFDTELMSKYPKEEVWAAEDAYKIWSDANKAPGSTIESVFKKGKKGELEKGFNVRTEKGLVDAGGHYNPLNNKAFVNENYGAAYLKWAKETGVHELNHKATVQFLRSPSGAKAREAISDMIKTDLADITRSGHHRGLKDSPKEYYASVAEVTARVQEGRLAFKRVIDQMGRSWPEFKNMDLSKVYTGDMSQISATGVDPVSIAEDFLTLDKGGMYLGEVLKGGNLKEKAISLINLFKVSPLVAGAASVTAVNAAGEEVNGGPKLLKGGKVQLLKK